MCNGDTELVAASSATRTDRRFGALPGHGQPLRPPSTDRRRAGSIHAQHTRQALRYPPTDRSRPAEEDGCVKVPMGAVLPLGSPGITHAHARAGLGLIPQLVFWAGRRLSGCLSALGVQRGASPEEPLEELSRLAASALHSPVFAGWDVHEGDSNGRT